MYTLNPLDIPRFDLTMASQFVKFWDQFYSYDVKLVGTEELIDYFAELNVGSDLTEENIRRLLRWKYSRHLTDPNVKTRERNPRVVKILAKLRTINNFRNGGVGEEDMRRTADEVFDSGMVYRPFLLHIAKPHAYPIGDQYVYRAYSLHTGQPEPQTWDAYAQYSDYFGRIAQAMDIARVPENFRALKRIDNALLAFGEFVKRYYNGSEGNRNQDPAYRRAVAAFVDAEASLKDPLEGKPVEGEFVEGQFKPAKSVQE